MSKKTHDPDSIKHLIQVGRLQYISSTTCDYKETFQMDDHKQLQSSAPKGETMEMPVHDIDSKVLCRAPIKAFEQKDFTGDWMHDNDNDNIFWDVTYERVVIVFKGLLFDIEQWDLIVEHMSDENYDDLLNKDWPLEKQ